MFMSDISIIVRKMRTHAERSQAEAGVGFPEQLVLMYLKAHGASNQETIAAQLDIDKGAVTKTVAKLENKGLVTRQVNPKNKREKLVELEPSALPILESMMAGYKDFEAKMFAGLTEEQVSDLMTSLAQVARNISE